MAEDGGSARKTRKLDRSARAVARLSQGVNYVSNKTTFETSQTDTHGIGSARSLRLKNSSQKKPSQYCDTALMRHTFRNECTEANFGARIRYSDNVSGPPPTSTVVLPDCVHRPPEQPYSSRIRHEDEKNASAISMRILQTPW
jgi:hypothetical protein